MSRLNVIPVEFVEHPKEKESKVVIWDADSLIHQCLYSGKNEETGERNPKYTEADLEYLQGKTFRNGYESFK